MAMTREQETMVADRLAFELIPANGKIAWDAAELTEGIGASPGDLEPAGYKRIVSELDRLGLGIHANPVNALYFRLTATTPVNDPEVAKRYLPRTGRPPAGIRVQQGADDPFAVLTARSSALRAASALPRAASRLADQVRTGVLTEGTKEEIVRDVRARASDAISPEIENSLRLMLPM
jgi:hypothetical protein